MNTKVSSARIQLKTWLKRLLAIPGAIVGSVRPSAGIRVLFYHRVNPHPFAELDPVSRECTVPLAEFERQLNYLNDHRFEILTLEEFKNDLADIESAKGTCRKVLITFDDGYEDNHEYALPVLQKLGVPATVFVPSEFIGKTGEDVYPDIPANRHVRFMSVVQLKDWLDAGNSLGSHTCSHAYLSSIPPVQRKIELEESRNGLEKLFNLRVDAIAYPGGEYAETILTEAAEAGYALGFTTMTGTNTSKSLRLALKRTEVSKSDSFSVFKDKLAGRLDWLWFKDAPFFRRIMNVTTGWLLHAFSGPQGGDTSR